MVGYSSEVPLWYDLTPGCHYGVHAGPYSTPTCAQGRHAITHLFEWKWSDIEKECVNFLGPHGYCGVQVSPPNENAVVTSPNRPWWERYQPVSYDLQTRSGNEQQFRSMVDTCNRNNVRIYVDAVVNHMTGNYSGHGTAGHSFDGTSCRYPGVPFGPNDCNGRNMCPSTSLAAPLSSALFRLCLRLVGLADLRLGSGYVQGKIAGYMNKLIDMGVAGFRVDAAKYMWPGDLKSILGRLHNLPSATFGSGKRPFVFLEVIDMGGGPINMSDYLKAGRVTDFIYGVKLADIFWRRSNQAKWLSNWGSAWGQPQSDDAVVFLNNHDNQRGHRGGGGPITFFNPKELKIATAFMLAHPYGFPRIMSSYSWPRKFVNGEDIHSWMGPPHNGNISTKDVQINSDMSCGGGWVCEHRWRQIYNMVAFRNVVHGTNVEHFWSRGDFQIAFARGNKGFIVMDIQGGVLNATILTGLPAGTYCDVISGNYDGNRCTGDSVNVDGSGRAHFHLNNFSHDPVMAIHIGAKLGSPKKVTT